jgi:hypothetical protein
VYIDVRADSTFYGFTNWHKRFVKKKKLHKRLLKKKSTNVSRFSSSGNVMRARTTAFELPTNMGWENVRLMSRWPCHHAWASLEFTIGLLATIYFLTIHIN